MVIFLTLFILLSCSGTSNLSQMQNGGLVITNYVEMVSFVEEEKLKNESLFFIDGELPPPYSINGVKLFYRQKNSKNFYVVDGIYNAGKFSFSLFLKKGDYLITIETTDENGNKYIQKDLSLKVK